MLKFLIITIVLYAILPANCLLYVFDTEDPPDYCIYQSSLCRYQGLIHFACNNNGNFLSTCPLDRAVVPMTEERIELILDLHNTWRSEVALGAMNGLNNETLPQATRMATMKWNQELADLALLNVKQCKMKHDACHNTAEFLFSGQNLATQRSSASFKDPNIVIKGLTMAWFNQYKSANGSNIERCCFSFTGADIGHFLTFVVDRSTEIGCAMTKFTTSFYWRTYVLACNYASASIAGYQLYRIGDVGSECITGMNPEYPGLCSADEPIDANKFY